MEDTERTPLKESFSDVFKTPPSSSTHSTATTTTNEEKNDHQNGFLHVSMEPNSNDRSSVGSSGPKKVSFAEFADQIEPSPFPEKPSLCYCSIL
ncbi:unnamed protein product, partial [Mesorhabditis belari]|uniref:Uncharacterized protein n=1 Tax=Mesorhabditis belari TaxID=2138241 RepID=A0AAF3FB79_9BILA